MALRKPDTRSRESGGAVLGAVFMQSLENGMVLLGVSSALRQVCIGLVLLLAVWIDAATRERRIA